MIGLIKIYCRRELKIMEYYEQIKETTPKEVVSMTSNEYFDVNLGFNPDLDFVPYTEFK